MNNCNTKTSNIKEDIKTIICEYGLEYIYYLLTKKWDKENKQSIDVSIQTIISNALKDPVKKNDQLQDIVSVDTFLFGDVHGQLDLFLQNLYIAGVIDETGCYDKTNKKFVIQLGDSVYGGPFELETLIYLRVLKKQAMEQGKDVILIAGNHELDYVLKSSKSKNEELISNILKSDIINKKMVLTYGYDSQKLMMSHSGMEKKVLIESLINMSKEKQFQKSLGKYSNRLNRIKKIFDKKNKDIYKISKKELEETGSKALYKILLDEKITFKELSLWMNEKFRIAVKNNTLKTSNQYCFLFNNEGSLIKGKKKAKNDSNKERGLKDINEFLINESEEKYLFKPVQIVGHKKTSGSVNRAFGNNGGIMQNKATIFADTGLVGYNGGNQGFVGVDAKRDKIYAVELRGLENIKISGLDSFKNPIELSKKENLWNVRKLQGVKLKSTLQDF